MTDKITKMDDWERDRVNRVLVYHNSKNSKSIILKDRPENIYPEFKGANRWDYVAYDETDKSGIAIEVKRLTDEEREQRGSIIWQVGKEIEKRLSCSLQGTFTFYADVPGDYELPNMIILEGEFLTLLEVIIKRVSYKLGVGRQLDISRVLRMLQIINKGKRLERWQILDIPNCLHIILRRCSLNGNTLRFTGSGMTYVSSPALIDTERTRFQAHVSKANEQLAISSAREKYLIVIDEGHRPINPQDLEKAFQKMPNSACSNITRAYYVSGDLVTELNIKQ